MWKARYFCAKHEETAHPEPIEGPFDKLRANGNEGD